MEPKRLTTKIDDAAIKGRAIVAKLGAKLAEVFGRPSKAGADVHQGAADMVNEGGREPPEPQDVTKKAGKPGEAIPPQAR